MRILAACFVILGLGLMYLGNRRSVMSTNLGFFSGLAFIIAIICLSNYYEEPRPTALDVYRGNTELKITSVNDTPIDSIVIFKEENIWSGNINE